MFILFTHAIITSTPCASPVFLSSYRNTILNQSACVLFWAIFYTIGLAITLNEHIPYATNW